MACDSPPPCPRASLSLDLALLPSPSPTPAFPDMSSATELASPPPLLLPPRRARGFCSPTGVPEDVWAEGFCRAGDPDAAAPRLTPNFTFRAPPLPTFISSLAACCRSQDLPPVDRAVGLPRPLGLCIFVPSTFRDIALLLPVDVELTGMVCATGASEVSVLSSLFRVELVFLPLLPPPPAELSSRLPEVRGSGTPPPLVTTLRPARGLSTPTTLLVSLVAGLDALLLGPGERVVPLPALT